MELKLFDDTEADLERVPPETVQVLVLGLDGVSLGEGQETAPIRRR